MIFKYIINLTKTKFKSKLMLIQIIQAILKLLKIKGHIVEIVNLKQGQIRNLQKS